MASETLFPWVGNKKFYLDFIVDHLPKAWNREKDNYIEPFLGSGVVFSAIKPKKAILNDSSTFLMDIYKCIKSNKNRFLSELDILYEKNSKEQHTRCKDEIFACRSPYKRAAMFWYLLRTSLYSFVCMKSDKKSFTCCYKSTGKPIHVKRELYEEFAKAISKKEIELRNVDFSDVIPAAKKNDLVFIDPPYMNEKRKSRKIYDAFTREMHEKLVELILQADKRGCFIMMFNHNHPYLLEKLSQFNVVDIDHKGMRGMRSGFADYREVLFTNYVNRDAK